MASTPGISPEEIEAELGAVLKSKRFANAQRSSGLLRFTVEQSLAGRANEIKESLIGVAVFDRKPDYDPGVDPVVRVRAGRLRALLEEYYRDEGRLDPIRIAIPKGGYVPAFRRIQMPEARGGRVVKWWLLAVLSVVLAAIVLWALVRGKPGGAPSVAVLPFLNLTGNPADDVLADGLAEELTTDLAQSHDCRVVARSSSFQFRGNRDVRWIGRQLETRYVIEGSVRREGQRLIVTSQLIETANGYHLLAGKYERGMGEAYAIPGEIAHSILRGIGVPGNGGRSGVLGAAGNFPLPEAYALYLHGRYIQHQKGTDNVRRAMEYYRKAVAIDPGYARAHGALALAHARFTFHQSERPGEDARLARESAVRAIGLAEETPEAHLALAMAAYWGGWNWREAEPHFRRAIEILPSYGTGHQAYALGLMTRRRFEESIAESRLALDLDPLSYAVSNDLATALYAGRRYEESIRRADQVLATAPSFYYAHLIKGSSLAAMGKYSEAVAEYRKVEAAAGNVEGVLGRLAYTSGMAGKGEELARIRAVLAAVPVGDRSAIYRAMAEIPSGDRGRVFEYLSKSVEMRETDVVFLDADPIWDAVRGDARFEAIRKRVGLE